MKKMLQALLLIPVFLGADVMAKSKLVGKTAPQFEAPALFPDGHVGTFNLQSFRHEHPDKNIVLYFYPMDNTPGCKKQAQKFRDDIEKLKKKI